MEIETVTLGGGCFWCLEAAFQRLKGVASVVSGYAGGVVPDPTYRQVCTGSTGHAEVVQVCFDNAVIDFATLLRVFLTVHDPTTLNRQGADVGTQYRSVVFYQDETQERVTKAVIADLDASGVWGTPIVTEVQPLQVFYPAEPYHQDYYRRNPDQGYCQAVIAPKLAKVRAQHASLMQS